jgi:uncharacterized membrane protein YccF (DUF307 family)
MLSQRRVGLLIGSIGCVWAQGAAEAHHSFGTFDRSVVQFATLKATVTARMFEMQASALWSAPVAGFLFCLLGGWWVARGVEVAHVRNGVVLGTAVAVSDLALLVVSGAPFGALMVSSVLSRIVGGYCGGKIALRRARRVRVAPST